MGVSLNKMTNYLHNISCFLVNTGHVLSGKVHVTGNLLHIWYQLRLFGLPIHLNRLAD